MGLVRKKATERVGGESAERETYAWDNLQEGEYECRLAYIADLGLQAKDYMGDFKGNFQQISLGVDVVDHSRTDEEGKTHARILWSKPFYIYDRLTEKGSELKYYKLFDSSADESTTPDWEAQLGKPVSAVVINTKGKGENSDKTFDNIKDLVPIPAKYQAGVAPAVATDVGIGDSDDPENPVTKGLFGLVKFIYDKRIGGESEPAKVVEAEPVEELAEDSPY